MEQFVIQLSDEIVSDLKEYMDDYSMNKLKVIAIEAIAKSISVAISTQHAKEQQEERVLAAEQLQLGVESRIIKLEELNQIPQE